MNFGAERTNHQRTALFDQYYSPIKNPNTTANTITDQKAVQNGKAKQARPQKPIPMLHILSAERTLV